jgi:hypothetical protein
MLEVWREFYVGQETGEQRPEFGVVAARTARLVEGFYSALECSQA